MDRGGGRARGAGGPFLVQLQRGIRAGRGFEGLPGTLRREGVEAGGEFEEFRVHQGRIVPHADYPEEGEGGRPAVQAARGRAAVNRDLRKGGVRLEPLVFRRSPREAARKRESAAARGRQRSPRRLRIRAGIPGSSEPKVPRSSAALVSECRSLKKRSRSPRGLKARRFAA
jgi:hypothetical protein